jgi:hypothetical protein
MKTSSLLLIVLSAALLALGACASKSGSICKMCSMKAAGASQCAQANATPAPH